MANRPVAEVNVDEQLVRRLLIDQEPDLSSLPLWLVANGWDNIIFRLGEKLVVRLPRRAQAAQLILNEQRWFSEVAAESCGNSSAARPSGVAQQYGWMVTCTRPISS